MARPEKDTVVVTAQLDEGGQGRRRGHVEVVIAVGKSCQVDERCPTAASIAAPATSGRSKSPKNSGARGPSSTTGRFRHQNVEADPRGRVEVGEDLPHGLWGVDAGVGRFQRWADRAGPRLVALEDVPGSSTEHRIAEPFLAVSQYRAEATSTESGHVNPYAESSPRAVANDDALSFGGIALFLAGFGNTAQRRRLRPPA